MVNFLALQFLKIHDEDEVLEHERHSQAVHMKRRKSGVSMRAQNSSLRSYDANIVAIDI